ncbi:chromate transporter [Ancylobacter sp. MQZ15Z-1]|uniref:Chromate transporter n=1 Tax=Ancylobacter mangrovi TaxID=2972472 RepID=A0A9X2PEG9_9HYPH|nr:chromate transporter [Ancylobacter mangrovi]MCS0497189.1 chromate transporter [Ancylobacter mangrovi]
MAESNPLIALAMVFGPLSLASIGGGVAILPAMQHQAVDVHQWMSPQDFVDLFAVARMSPGPGSMLATLIGWKLYGVTGAFVATVALFLPSSFLCYAATLTWDRHKGTKWHSILQEGLTPVGTGLLAAGAISLFRIADAGPASWAIAGATAGILLLRPRFPPISLLMAAGLCLGGLHLLGIDVR